MFARTAALLATLLVLAPLAAAAPPPSPTSLPLVDRYLYAEFDLAQPDLTSIELTAELFVYRYDVRGKIYDADDLGNAYVGANKYSGEPSGSAFVEEIESAVEAGIQRTLAASFPGADISGIAATVDRTSLVAGSGNPFDPPVHVSVVGHVERTRTSVGLGTFGDDAVAAAFAAGARVGADFSLDADPGYRIVYTIHAPASPAGIRFATGPGVSADRTNVVVEADNAAGALVVQTTSVTLVDPAATAPTAEDVRSTIEVTMGDIAKGDAGIPITVDVEAAIHALDVNARFPGVLPEKVALPFLNAGGVRALRAAGAISDADVAKANEGLLKTIREDVSRAFGPDAVVTGGLDSQDLAKPATKPYADDAPLQFAAQAKTTYVVEGASADDVDLALRIGGTANVDLDLFPANGRDTTFVIYPPSFAELAGAEGGTVEAAGAHATFEVPGNVPTYAAKLQLRGKDVPAWTAEDAAVGVTVDLQDLDVTIGKVVGGDFGNLIMEITVRGDLGVIAVPEELRGSLPDDLELDFLSADAIRLLVDRGKISSSDLADLEKRLLDQVRENLGTALGGTVPVTGGLDRATLAASLVSTPISGDTPVRFTATARLLKPLAGGEVQPQAAIALYTQQLPLTLPKLEGLDTTYTVVLPRGLAVTDVAVTGGTTESGKSADGRDQFTVTPEGGNADVTVSMAVTPTFVLIKFWPLVLLAVILLVLIVGTPIALVARSRGKKKKAAAKK